VSHAWKLVGACEARGLLRDLLLRASVRELCEQLRAMPGEGRSVGGPSSAGFEPAARLRQERGERAARPLGRTSPRLHIKLEETSPDSIPGQGREGGRDVVVMVAERY